MKADKMPWKFVENEGFLRFISVAIPHFRPPSRFTVTRDCCEEFVNIKDEIGKHVKMSDFRISLTTNTCTCDKGASYMVMTGHYIDNKWTLVKRILSFVLISSHNGRLLVRS